MMTTALNDSREIAAKQLADIEALERNENFQRYFLPRLRSKRLQVYEKFRNDPPEKCSYEEREIRRRLLDVYDEILKMMETDKAVNRSILSNGT